MDSTKTLKCAARECPHPATRGENWGNDQLGPVETYRVGVQLRLTVLDMAVGLTLCEEHAQALTALAWNPVLAQLAEWGWRPLRSIQQ